MDPLLYGHNSDERIVAVQQLNDQTIRLYKRIKGKILHQDGEFFPFFFLTDNALIKDFPKKFWLKELSGNNTYRYIVVFTRWSEMWEAVHFVLRSYNKIHSSRISSYQDLKEILIRADAVRQFFLQSGVTLFKGMEYQDLVRLHLDIQIAPASKKKQGGKSEAEQILVITLAPSKGKEIILTTQKKDEREILELCVQHINSIDPDIIESYDLFGTILPALARACERQRIPFTIGRGGTDMRIPSGHGGIGSGENEWYGFDVPGRHLIDLLTLAETELEVKKSEQTFTLISLAKHFGISIDSQPFIPSHQIRNEWHQAPRQITNQSRRIIQIIRALYDRLAPPLFYLAQMCPLNYRMLIQLSGASRIEALMLREYVHQKHSLPKSFETSRNISIPSEIYRTGVFSDILYIEVEGLYSSVILDKNIKPKKDELNSFLTLLNNLSLLQQEIVSRMHADQESGNHALMHQHKALKLLKDAFHLYLGSAKGLFNDPDNAEVVLTTGREILKEVMHQIELFNATIIQSDSQGFFLLPPDNIIGENNQRNFVERLSTTLPKGINFVLSHRYKGMFSYRKSNYAIMDQRMNVFIKGNGLISRNMERYLRIVVQRFIECLLTNDFKRLHHAYATAYIQALQHKWSPADFCKTDVAKIDSETYQREVTEGQMVPIPAMEAAIRSSIFVSANEKISYYITGGEADASISRFSRLVEEWDPLSPNENTAYYLSRLQETVNKFREFFDPSAFERIVSMDEMFGFSDEGIRILARKSALDTPETKSDSDDYSIWLAETE